MWSAVWRRLFRAFKSAPARASTSITEGSSPKAAWCTARSPSLSYIDVKLHSVTKSDIKILQLRLRNDDGAWWKWMKIPKQSVFFFSFSLFLFFSLFTKPIFNNVSVLTFVKETAVATIQKKNKTKKQHSRVANLQIHYINPIKNEVIQCRYCTFLALNCIHSHSSRTVNKTKMNFSSFRESK